MDKRSEELLEDKVNAGRGVAKSQNPESEPILMKTAKKIMTDQMIAHVRRVISLQLTLSR